MGKSCFIPVTEISETEPAPLIGLTYEEAVKRPFDALIPESCFDFPPRSRKLRKIARPGERSMPVFILR